MARRALVTGATGFVGGRLAAALADRGWAVRCLVRDRSRAQGLADRGFELHEADVLDAQALRGAGEGVEIAYYLIHAMGRGTPGAGSRSASGRARGTSPRWRSARESPGTSTWAGWAIARGRAPAQPPPDRRDPLRAGPPAHLLPGRDDRRGGKRVLPHAALPRAAASRDDRPRVAEDAHAGDRDRRRDRLPGGGARRPRLAAARCRSPVPTSSPTARCSI